MSATAASVSWVASPDYSEQSNGRSCPPTRRKLYSGAKIFSAKVHELEAKVARLEKELHTAHTILDVQGKVAGLLGFSLEYGKDC